MLYSVKHIALFIDKHTCIFVYLFDTMKTRL